MVNIETRDDLKTVQGQTAPERCGQNDFRGKSVFRHGLDGSQLKLIAVLTMLADHIAFLLLGRGYIPALAAELRRLTGAGTTQAAYTTLRASYDSWLLAYRVMRSIGRIAFPIYAFLLVEGFFHTRNWRRYTVRLAVFALLSEIPFNLMTASHMVSPVAQNVFFTLLLGLLMMKAMDTAGQWPGLHRSGWPAFRIGGIKSKEGRQPNQPAPHPSGQPEFPAATGSGHFLQLIIILAAAFLAWCLHTDYDYDGILLIAFFYCLRNERWRGCLMGFAWMLCTQGQWHHIPGYVISFGLIWLYNGKRGRQPWKYAFYLFYPAHMLVLFGIYQSLFTG